MRRASPARGRSPGAGRADFGRGTNIHSRPAIHGKALCFAQASCGDGTYVSCYGYSSTTSCSAADRNCDAGVQGHVKCDGVKTKCPVACPVIPPDCGQLEAQCAATCGTCPVTSFTCSPYSCRCGFNSICA